MMSRKNKKQIGFFLATISMGMLVGCVTSHPYLAPTGGDTAKLIFKPRIGQYVKYNFFTFDDAQACANPKILASNVDAKNASTATVSTAIRSGRLSSFLFRTHSVGTCEIAASFYPQVGHSYLLTGIQEGGRCGLLIDDVTDINNPRPEKSYVSRKISSWDGKCLPIPLTTQTDTSVSGTKNPGKEPSRGLEDFKDLLPNK